MSTTQELLALKERHARLLSRIEAYARHLAATDYRGPRPAEHFIADALLAMLEDM